MSTVLWENNDSRALYEVYILILTIVRQALSAQTPHSSHSGGNRVTQGGNMERIRYPLPPLSLCLHLYLPLHAYTLSLPPSCLALTFPLTDVAHLGTRSYLVSYGAGNVRSLANAISSQGFEFKWIEKPEDFEKADVG